MPIHRLILIAAIPTLLGLDAVFLQVQRVRLGYRVAQETNRMTRLQEEVRRAEIQVSRRRDPAALQARAASLGVGLPSSAAGHVVRVSPQAVVVAGRTEMSAVASAR